MKRIIFSVPYILTSHKELEFYKKFRDDNSISYNELKERQEKELRRLITYVSKNIVYYQKLFKKNGIIPSDIQRLDDLKYLPTLNKQLIRENFNDFLPQQPLKGFHVDSTGGSTGTPLKYRVSKECYERGVGLLYRGWNYAGYNPGDRMAIIAGTSLVSKKTTLRKSLVNWSRNFISFSSFGVSKETFRQYAKIISTSKPNFLRGYASSIFLLSKNIQEMGGIVKLRIKPPKAIFSTAEMLSEAQRTFIENIFKCKVYNQYGLNDGGISAYENRIVDGMLIDTERSIMESVDENNVIITGQSGRLLATSLYNYDFPFIRYETGDVGEISTDYISNGGNRLVLKNLFGRITDFIEIQGNIIGSPVLTVLMGKTNALRYQVIQKLDESIEVRVDPNKNWTLQDEDFVKKSFLLHIGTAKIKIIYTSDFINSGNKHKFIFKESE